MPRYFFDAYDGREHCIDPEGEDLGGDDEARSQATAIIVALIRDDPHFDENSGYHISVRRDGELVIYNVNCALTESW